MTLADILTAHGRDMLRLWMEAVRREAPETQGLSETDLTSNFPLLFDRLIRGLEGEPPTPIMPESREHAATRKRQGIGLPTLLREYTLLQQTIRTFASEMLGAKPGDSESRTIDAILFRAVEEAVLTYTASKEAELAMAKGRSDHLIAALAHDIRTPAERHGADPDRDGDEAGRPLRRRGPGGHGLDAGRDHGGPRPAQRHPRTEQAGGGPGRRPSRPPSRSTGAGELRPGRAVVGHLQGDCGRQGTEERGDPAADRAMLQQVVGNLLSNAIRYTVRGSITVRSRLEDGAVRVEVEDTGIGMTPEDQVRIFEEFFQVDGATVRSARDTAWAWPWPGGWRS